MTKNKHKEKIIANNTYEKFELKKDRIIINTSFPEGENYNMALDLGAGTVILLSNCGLSFLESQSPVLSFGKIISADNQKTKANYYKIGEIQTDAFTLNNAFVPLIPDFQISPCDKFVGVWGADIFEGKVLALKMEDSTMAVMDALPSLVGWKLVESEYKYPHFYIVLRIGNKKMSLLFDTGCTSGVIISQNFYDEFYGEEYVLTDTRKLFGRVFNTASGLSDPDTTIKAIIENACWGEFSIDSIPILMSNKIKRNVIGMGFLERFNFLLDYKNYNIYIQENPKFNSNKRQSVFTNKGFSIRNSMENIITITVLQINSPAEKAGMRIGDQVLSINNIITNSENNCDVIKQLTELDGNLTNYQIIVKRDNEILKFVL